MNRKLFRGLACGLLLLAIAAALVYTGIIPAPSGTPKLAAHYINVGQGDSALVTCGGKSLLIDGGNPSDWPLICDYLAFVGVERLDYLVSTHPHTDHSGGLAEIVKALRPREAYLCSAPGDTTYYEDFLDKLLEYGISTSAPARGDSFALGEASCVFLSRPDSSYDLNNSSLVLKITLGESSFLFTGDIEKAAEEELVSSGQDLSCTVLKVAHHGSSTSSSAGFLKACSPEIAVISCGERNSYGHPHGETLAALSSLTIYRTDLGGTIVLETDGAGVTLKPSSSQYIGNKKSLKLHMPYCRSLPAEQNRVIFTSRSEALAQGYSVCGSCRP